MAELTADDITWKKGERGTQKFILYDSDGTAKHTLTGHTYTFKFWAVDASSNKGSGSLTITDGANGEASYSVGATDTDTAGEYIGEVIETDTNLKTKTFKVSVLSTAPA